MAVRPMLLLITAALLLLSPAALAEPVTFFVSPDTHFTSSGGSPDVAKNARGIHDMNLLPGTPYPAASQWKGSVETEIRGVVIPGDLVDDGGSLSFFSSCFFSFFLGCPLFFSPHYATALCAFFSPYYARVLAVFARYSLVFAPYFASFGAFAGCNTAPTAPGDPGCAEQWDNYTSYFKTAPNPGETTACRYPAFEGVGNHDGGNSTDVKSGLVRRGVIARNRQRGAAAGTAGAANYSMSPNGLHYSWDWGGVHFAMLGVYPGTVGDCAAPGEGKPGNGCCSASSGGICWGWHSPEQQVDKQSAVLCDV